MVVVVPEPGIVPDVSTVGAAEFVDGPGSPPGRETEPIPGPLDPAVEGVGTAPALTEPSEPADSFDAQAEATRTNETLAQARRIGRRRTGRTIPDR